MVEVNTLIEFPGLGLKFDVNRVAFTMFGRDVYWYGIIIGIGFVIAVLFAMSRRKKYAVSMENILDFVLVGLPCAVVGARMVYVIGDPDCWNDGLMGIIAVWDGGLSIYGGLGFAILGCLIYIKVKGLNALRCLDFAAPSFMIGQMIGRWGNFINAEVYGRATTLPWGMRLEGGEELVHPLFFYECIWMLIGFIALVIYSEKRKRNGEIFSLYLIWYGSGRIWMEFLREEEFVLRIFGLPMSAMLSAGIIVLGICMLLYIYIKKPEKAMEKTIFADGEFVEVYGKGKENL